MTQVVATLCFTFWIEGFQTASSQTIFIICNISGENDTMRIMDGEYYRLRTWYIHHQHARQWKRPRIVELEGDGTTWHNDVLQAWRDQLYNEEVLNIAVVFPEIRAQTDRPVLPHADLILVQGGHDRCGGIATVYLPRQTPVDSYTWAISYPRHISGIEVVQGAEAEHFLDSHELRIYHDWTPIPVTTTRTHWMLNGHSFVVIVNENQASASSSVRPEPSAHNLNQAEANANLHEALEEESPTSDEAVPPNEQLQGVQVFGLERHTHHCFVHWDSYNTILFEVLRSMGLQRDAAVGYHYFEVPLIDQHPAEEAILLQKVGDIPGGSPDRLALVDITYLAPRGDRPLQRREVQRLPRYLGRTGLLQELGIQEQCDQSDFQCTIHLNNQLWHEDDLALKQLKHAAYVRVEIPPMIECHSPEQARPTKRAHVQTSTAGDLAGTTRGTALYQIGLKIEYRQPVTQSATFPSLRAAPQQQQSLAGRGTPAVQTHEQAWLPQASMAFVQCATTEHQEEGPVIYWTTWYLHHQRYMRNSESRLLRLDDLQHLWYQDLCALWSDVMDPSLPGRVHHVHPEPPADDRQVSAGHLILEQGHGDLLPTLLTGVFDHPTERRLWHFAGLMRPFITRHEVFEELGINRWCTSRVCTLKSGGITFHGEEPIPIEAGENIVVTIASRQDATAEATSLMQHGRPVLHGEQGSTTPVQAAVTLPAEGDACEVFSFNVEAPEFYPARPDLQTFPEDIQDLFALWTQRTFMWGTEERAGILITWYIDQQDPARRVCQRPRSVRLTEALHTWEPLIRQTWADMLNEAPFDIHLVRPSPPGMQPNVVAHAIVIQRPQPTLCSILLTIFDYASDGEGVVMQMATTMHEHIRLEQIIHSLGRTQQCLLAGSTQTCHAWHEAQPLQLGTPWPGRDGSSIVMTFMPRLLSQTGTNLLQTRHTLTRSAWNAERTSHPVFPSPECSERLTRESVAHDHGPEHRRPISLHSLLSIDGKTKAVKLKAGHTGLTLPSFLEVSATATEPDIEGALCQWGFNCAVIKCGQHDKFLCFQRDFQFDTQHVHYLFVNEDEADKEGEILHSQTDHMSHLDIMKFLDGLGYSRAVVLDVQTKHLGINYVTFCNSMPQPPVKEVREKVRTPWPPRLVHQWQEGPLFSLNEGEQQCGSQRVHTGFDRHDIEELTAAGDTFLQTDFSGIDLPDYIQEKINPATKDKTYDRWLIFTDGSSMSSLRRLVPQQADDLGQPDTWAMLVLGEQFHDNGTSTVETIGWCTHPVRYDTSGANYTFAERIGAEVAERQALIWAGLWRLTQNSLTPTVFCCDSMTCGQQAFGGMGTASPDESYRLMRSIFQCLEHGLPPDHLHLHHVYSHTGDPYNEFVDMVAKLEMSKSFHHAWPRIDMRKWNKILPYYWLVFGDKCGLPAWNNGVLNVNAPDLPKPMQEQSFTTRPARPAKTSTLKFTLSLASANVLSISRNPDGHAGKLHYLFAQMKALGINIIGIQEGRAEEGMTSSNQIIRFMSGHDHGQGGVEIWINLDQPYGCDSTGKSMYFKEHNFQVLHRDPRRLLVNLQADGIHCCLFTAHAPHSGRPREERETWWEETTELIWSRTAQQPCVWLIDANAEPGTADGEVVYRKGLRTSANTIFMRTSFQKLHMCLPSTLPVHEGPLATWTAPNGDDHHCIDYVAIPTSWKSSCTLSRVLEEFDLATSRDDHKAVGIELTWQTEVQKMTKPSPQPKVEWSSENVRQQIAHAMKDVKCVPWHTDVESQEKEFSSQVGKILRPFCRTTKTGPKKCYIDDEIWQTRHQVLQYRKRLKKLKDHLRREALHLAFGAWKGNNASRNIEEMFNYGTTLRCSSLRLYSHFTVLRRRLREKLTQAKQKIMQQRLQQVTEHTEAFHILRLMRDFTGPTNPRKQKQKTLPMVENPQGQLCSTPWEARQTWIAFFADMEGGHRQSYEELHADWLRALREEPLIELELQAHQLPTLTDLELAFRRVAGGKATGPDRIPGELCRYAPKQCARANFSALWKLLLHGHEALQFKGGLLVQAYKGSGEKTHCSSFRSLLISSHIGKAIHRSMRSAQAHIFEGYLQIQQLGGRRAMPVTYGVHLVRAFLRQARHHNNSSALILLDLKEAFYRILRPLCMGGKITDEVLATLMSRLNMPSDALHVLHRLLQEPCALDKAGMQKWEQRSIRAVHSQTHFWMQHQQDVVQTMHGSRPGDPFADVIFSYVWALVLRQLQEFLVQQDLLSCFSQPDGFPIFREPQMTPSRTPFLGPTWMDDLAVCLEGEEPQRLLRKVGIATGRLRELCTEHAMSPNLKKNKTEILLSLQGHESRKHKKLLYGPAASGTLPVINEYGTFHVTLTTRYRHLGGLVHHKADQRDEIRRRIGIAHGTVTQHRKLLFRNWSLPLQKRPQLLESLVLSKLLYGAETWIATDDRTVKVFHSAVIKLYRRLLPVSMEQHLTDDEILSRVHLPSPSELLRRARLRYVATLLHCGDRSAWGLIAQDKQWTSLVEEDMTWMWQQIKHSSQLKDPRQHWEQWQDLIMHHRSYWRRLTRRAFEHAILQRCNECHVADFHHKALVIFRELYRYQPHQQISAGTDVEVRGCLFCRKRCKNSAGEAAHMFRAHGRHASRRELTDTPTCPACLKNYHTMEKVNAHLYYSTSCRRTLQSRNYSCPIAQGAGSETDRIRQAEHDRLLPPIQAEGPHPAPSRGRTDQGIDNDLHVAIMEACIDAVTPHLAVSRIMQIADERPISWTTWTATVYYFLENVEATDFADWETDYKEVLNVFQQLLDPTRWDLQAPFLKELTKLPDLEQECRDIVVTTWERHEVIPRCFGKHRVLLHLFSGRRRQGDVQFFLDNMEPPTGYILHVVSMDIVVDDQWGDATNEQTRDYWLSAAHAGYIVGFLAGPPCETWSVARGRALHDPQGLHKRAPRILRTAEFLWGLPSLALKELNQVMIGNFLLTFSLLMGCVMVKTGGLGVIEHPAEPTEEELAAIWRLPLVQALLQAPGVCRHRVAQGLYGAPSAKPTDLLVINLSTLPRAFSEWRLRQDTPKGASIGLTADGVWKTGILKEYPPAMCRALAVAFRQGMDRLPVVSTTEPEASDIMRWQALHCTVYSKHIGQNFAS
jgi:hypothetical protein